MEPRSPKPEPARRTVLVVDADAQSLRIVDVSLRRAGFDVRAASDGTAAASLIERTPPPDLVISDVDLPGLDGFELCRRAKARSSKIPFVFLARPNTANRIKSVELGADDYLSKPVFVKEVVGRVSALLQRHERERLSSADTLGDRVSGNLGDLSMIDLLQTIAMNGKSGVLHLRTAAGAHGEVYFRKGAVVDAEVSRLSGADAVYRLLSWSEGRFEIEWRNIRRRDTVALSAPALLMEGMRRLDEWTRQLQQLPPLDTVFEVDYRLLAERLADIPDEVNGILRLFDGLRTAIQVIDDCGLSDLEALTVIGKLSNERLIRNVAAEPADEDAKGGPELEGWLSGAPAAPSSSSASSSVDADADARQRRASDAGATARTPAPAPTSPDRPLSPGLFPERRERPADPRHEDRAHGDAGIPELRPEEPAVVIPFPSSGAPARQTLVSASSGGGPVAAVAGEISNGIPTGTSSAPPSGPTHSSVSVPRSTDPGLGPLSPAMPPPQVEPPAHSAPLAHTSSPAHSPLPAHRPSAPEPSLAAAAPVPAPAPHRDSSPKVPELPFSDSASRWMTEGDQIHTGRNTKAEAIDELGLPSRFRGWMVIAAVAALAGGVVFAMRAMQGTQAAEPVAEKPAAPPSAAARNPSELPANPTPPPAVVPAAGEAPPSPSTAGAAALPDTARPGAAAPAKPAAGLTAVEAAPANAGPGGETAAPADDVEAARLLSVCQSAFNAGRMKEATTTCTAAVQASPESAKALALLAHAEFNRSHRKEALSWAEKAIKLDPKLADAYVIVGGVQQDAGRNADAKSAYRKYLELAPKGQYAPDLRAIVDSL